jgi:hypothetical protein
MPFQLPSSTPSAQSKIKLSHINRSANVSTKSQDLFLQRQFPE